MNKYSMFAIPIYTVGMVMGIILSIMLSMSKLLNVIGLITGIIMMFISIKILDYLIRKDMEREVQDIIYINTEKQRVLNGRY